MHFPNSNTSSLFVCCVYNVLLWVCRPSADQSFHSVVTRMGELAAEVAEVAALLRGAPGSLNVNVNVVLA